MKSLVLLLAYVCTSDVRENCEVWQQDAWSGKAAYVYCTAARDEARASAIDADRPYEFYACAKYDQVAFAPSPR